MESESSSRRLGNFGLLGDSKYIGVIDSTTFRAKDLNLSHTLFTIDISVICYVVAHIVLHEQPFYV